MPTYYVPGQASQWNLTGKWSGTWVFEGNHIPCEIKLANTGGNLYEGTMEVRARLYVGGRPRTYTIQITGEYNPERSTFNFTHKPGDRYALIKSDCTPIMNFQLLVTAESLVLTGFSVPNATCTADWRVDVEKAAKPDEVPAHLAYMGNLDSMRIMKDSLQKKELAGRKLTYLDCKQASAFQRQLSKFPGKECPDLTVFVDNHKDTFACVNLAFSPQIDDRSYSFQSSLCKDDNNTYDSRFLGTWHTKDFKVIYEFNASGSVGTAPFIATMFTYDEIHGVYQTYFYSSPVRVYATNIESVLFLESELTGLKVAGENKTAHIPLIYKITDNTHMTITPVSFNYKMPLFSFSSKFDYRKYFQQNISKPDFVTNAINLLRFDRALSSISQLNDTQKRALQELDEELMRGRRVEKENSFNDPKKTLLGMMTIYQSNQKMVTGFDQYWNPLFENDATTGREMYFDANGNHK